MEVLNYEEILAQATASSAAGADHDDQHGPCRLGGCNRRPFDMYASRDIDFNNRCYLYNRWSYSCNMQ